MRMDKITMENGTRCGNCKGWKSHGCIGECQRASYVLVTRANDNCMLNKRRA